MTGPRDAVQWAESFWVVPELGRPAPLPDWQRQAMRAAFPLDGGPSAYETFLIGRPKKQDKTGWNSKCVLFAALTRAEELLLVVANDAEQARQRVFDRIVWQLRHHGMERSREVSITQDEIHFRDTGTVIQVVAADYAGEAGAIFGVSSWTELWAYRYEQNVRLWEELTPVPNRHSLRFVDSYAGYTGDAPVLEPLWQRALAGEEHDGDVFTNGRLWAHIATGEEAQASGWLGDPRERDGYYQEQKASLRPGTYQRLHLNLWASGEEAFVTAEDWDACVDPEVIPVARNPEVPVFAGVDVGLKSDCSAVAVVGWAPADEHGEHRLQLLDHRIWRNPGQVLNLSETVAPYVLGLTERFHLRKLLYDPSQFIGEAQRLALAMPERGIGVFSTKRDDPSYSTLLELPQTVGNLTLATESLYRAIKTRQLLVYPDADLRQHILNAVGVQSATGWRLAKEKASRKIDAAVALSFACLAALTEPPEAAYEPVALQTITNRYAVASGAPLMGSVFGG